MFELVYSFDPFKADDYVRRYPDLAAWIRSFCRREFGYTPRDRGRWRRAFGRIFLGVCFTR